MVGEVGQRVGDHLMAGIVSPPAAPFILSAQLVV